MFFFKLEKAGKKNGRQTIYTNGKSASDVPEYVFRNIDFCKSNHLCLSFVSESYEQTARIIDLCHKNKVSVNDYLIAKLMLVLACYLRMTPELIDAVAIATLGNYKSKAGLFVGSKMFGYLNRCGYSITNLGKYESESITDAVFIPPASPANRKTVGVVTVNGILHTCTAMYQ